tara:strand:+ start:1965 stop:2846 length:882 start_codon:yes stop_codon:yes gene_type:complete
MKSKIVTAIVSNDAGAAEILSSFVKSSKNNFVFVLSGPAKKIFKKKIKKPLKILDLNSAEKVSNKLICGTSGKAKIEVKAISKFKKSNKHTIALVEHWTNYKIRFKLKKKLILPNKIWVFDKHAKEKMKNTIKTKIIIKKNYYLSDIKKQIKKIKKSNNNLNILYVSEPVSEIKNNKIANYKKSKEYKSIKYFNDNINAITKKKYQIYFRLHPSEKASKYKWLKYLNEKIKISKKKSLLQDIIKSDIVVGRQTMALVVALKCGRRVVSCIPGNEKRCIIPYSGIKELRDLLKK